MRTEQEIDAQINWYRSNIELFRNNIAILEWVKNNSTPDVPQDTKATVEEPKETETV